MSDSHKNVQYQLRLPEQLRERIKESAELHNRSMNQDIVARLEQSFNQAPTQDERMQHLEKELAETKKIIAINAGFFENLLGEKDGQFAKYFNEQFPQFKDDFH